MRKIPTPHTIYRHFKGNLYQVQCIATDSEDGKQMVVYQALYGDYKFYVRPLEMFMSPVDHAKYPDVKQEYRFEEVTVKQDIDPKKEVEPKPESELDIDPKVLEFLDADTYERRLEILTSIGYRITDDMIDIMSTVVDIEVPNGDAAKRYEDFKEALMTRKRYECNRFGR